jgi:hypothetical protein
VSVAGAGPSAQLGRIWKLVSTLEAQKTW